MSCLVFWTRVTNHNRELCSPFSFCNVEFADVRGITNRKTVLEGYENVQAALLDYTLTCYPTVSVSLLDRCAFKPSF